MALALSLGGGLHCMGMCGGFAVLANAGLKRIGLNGRFVAYSIGKTLTYGILGVSVGWFRAQLSDWKTGGVEVGSRGLQSGKPLLGCWNPPFNA
ncbi:MAG: sulfite exporter TauE/SafE family protein [Bacteroidota bacterium]|nr:sulfite exporter TauE/SafE family protein [Bacteroidota bacterium]